MTLQLPVEAGHEGGLVVVRHRGEENLFEFVESSSRYFYLTVYSYWEFDLEKVTFVWRLAIVIGLELFERSGLELVDYPLVVYHRRFNFRIPFHTNNWEKCCMGGTRAGFKRSSRLIVVNRNEVPVGYALVRPGILVSPKDQPL